MQAKIAALHGEWRSMYVRKRRSMLCSKGMRLGHLDMRGMRRVAPSRTARSLAWFVAQVCPCRMCHACKPEAKLDSVEPEYAPAQLVRKAERRV